MEKRYRGFAVGPVAGGDETGACFPVIRQLRPSLDRAGFLAAADRQRAAGFRLIAARTGDDTPVGLAGFWVRENLAWGRHVYIDDLITDEDHRGLGVGAALLDWIVAFAGREGCRAVHLDSGVQRHDAHRFYLTHGFRIASHHFSRDLAP